MPRFNITSESRVWMESRSSIHPIHWEATGLTGELEVQVAAGRLDSTQPHGGRLELPVERLQSGNRLYDSQMQRQIEVRKFPTIQVKIAGFKELDGTDRYRASGEVVVHGVTRSVDGEVKITLADGHTLVMEGEQDFDIRDFGLTPPKLLMLRVYPDVKVRARIVAR